MTTPKRWFGPRSTFSILGDPFQFGDCTCCGCLFQSGTDSVADTTLDAESFYPRFENGARVRLVIADIPSSFSYELASAILTDGFGVQYQSVTSVTVTGLEQLNATRLINLPMSQYKCIWPRRNIYTESFDINCAVEVVTNYTNDGCATSTQTTDTSSDDFTITLSVGAYKSVFPLIETAEGGKGSPFRYVLMKIAGWPCFFEEGNLFYPYLGMINAYWPFVSGVYELDRGTSEGVDACSTGLGIDGKRIGDVASGTFFWRETDPFSPPVPNISNDPSRVASLCGLTGGANTAYVTGAVGSYSMEIERL